ncbi:hypothetical protein F3Y22_tig00110678pilonHSYRG00476 [Hibiscus syriacus]|uniref:SAP domain-containing protein n=1 Tax=Hibiscus syriacus TaxID=106335 RepID=A0A6A2ZX86_HIBSY|nr:hypothetical protein F3Y22_tig00110678pilonHSYRG00476 [Hibiscus syriacus]
MSSKFQILDNRPIDKWKVVELREELKRRHLTTRGLKKDLVRRLDVAVRTEREKAANEAANGFNNGDSQPAVEEGTEKVNEVVDHGGLKLEDNITDCPTASGHGVVEKRGILVEREHLQSWKLEENVNSNMEMECQDPVAPEPKDDMIDDNVKISLDVVEPVMAEPYSSTGSGHGVVEERHMLVEDEPVIQTIVVKTVIPEVPLPGQNLQSSKQEENVNSDVKMESGDRKHEVESDNPKAQLENQNQEDDIHKKVKDVGDYGGGENEEFGLKFKDDISDCVDASGHGVIEEGDKLVDDKASVTKVPLIGEHLQSWKQEENAKSHMQTESRDQTLEVEKGSPKVEAESDDPKAQLENENQEDGMHNKVEDVVDHSGGENEECELTFKDDINNRVAASGHGVIEESDMVVDDKATVTEGPLIGEHLHSSKQEENANSNMQTESRDQEFEEENGSPNLEVESDDPKAQQEIENQEDDMHKKVEDVVDHGGGEIENGCGLKFKDDISDCVSASGHEVVEEIVVEDKPVVAEVPLIREHLQSSKQEENVKSNMQTESQVRNLEVESDDPKTRLENENQEDDIHKKVKDVGGHGGGENKECELKFKDDISDCVAASGHGVIEETDMLVDDKASVTEVPLIGEHSQSSKQEENVNSNTQMENQDRNLEVENGSSKPEESDDPKAQLGNDNQEDDMHKKVENVADHGDSENEKWCGLKFKDDISDCEAASAHGVVEESDMVVEDKPLVTEVPLIGEHLQRSKQEENTNSSTQMECQDGKFPVDNESPKVEAETDDPKAQLENGDDKHGASSLNNQIPEINQISGFQAKSDSMSISEKIELKDNLIDVKLTQDVVKPEMVRPCSYSNVVPDNGQSHSMDDEQPLENKTSVDDERDDKNDTSTADTSNTDDSEERVYSEKLNFDRSSSDDSMDKDLPETKQCDSQSSTDEIGEDSEENESLIIKELAIHVVAGDGSSTDKNELFVDNKSHYSIPAVKRKLQDEEAKENSESPKRYKWNSDDFTLTDTPKDTMQPAASRSKSSSSDSTDSEDTTKDQDVPVIILYMQYPSVQEAMETHNAIYNPQWPPNGGRLLVAEFLDPHEVERLTSQSQPSTHQQVPPPLLPSEEPGSPMLTLDDLFWTTKATPKIYHLPLPEEQVPAKQATHERNTRQ